MYVSSYEGETLLHATSDVESRGRGPMEVHGAPRRAEEDAGDAADLQASAAATSPCAPDASLHFTDVGEYFGGSYWKVHQLARFTLRKVRPDGEPSARSCGPARS